MRMSKRLIMIALLIVITFGFTQTIKAEAATTVSDMNIVSSPEISKESLSKWAKSRGATDTFISLIDLYYKYAAQHGNINPVIAYIQAAKETNFGKFTGLINESFCNPCGLKTHAGGADDDINAHQRFSSWDEGVQAHLDHLALYAGASGYPRASTYDPRHFASIFGVSPTVTLLGGHWAPSSSYGTDIIGMYNELVSKYPLDVIQNVPTVTTTDKLKSNQVDVPLFNPTTVKQGPLVVIDPGHNYGGDYGATGNIGGVTYSETDLNMQVALLVKKYLEDAGYRVILTRNPEDRAKTEVGQSLAERVKIANDANADLFVSIHQNAFNGSVSGTEVYYSVNATDKEKSKALAQKIVDNISSSIGNNNRGAKTQDYYVLENTEMLAILVECGFIDNASDVQKISDPNGQAKVANAIVDGIKVSFPYSYSSIVVPENSESPQVSTSTENSQVSTSTENPKVSTSSESPKVSTSTESPQVSTGTVTQNDVNTNDNFNYGIVLCLILGVVGILTTRNQAKNIS